MSTQLRRIACTRPRLLTGAPPDGRPTKTLPSMALLAMAFLVSLLVEGPLTGAAEYIPSPPTSSGLPPAEARSESPDNVHRRSEQARLTEKYLLARSAIVPTGHGPSAAQAVMAQAVMAEAVMAEGGLSAGRGGGPSAARWWELLFLRQYNTRLVMLGVALLGCAAGMVGSFTLLRKRALMGDALAHATLPGICLAFVLATQLGVDGKSLPLLLLGATLTGLLGLAVILLLRTTTRLKEDTAMGAVLSVFFGGGMALLGVIQQMQDGHAAGLESFIYGKTASMSLRDVQWIAYVSASCIVACLLLFKEFKLLCFDAGFAGARGFPVLRLDVALMALVVLVCIVGLQAVGLILVIALLIIPAAAARFWTEKLWAMFLISGALGALGGLVGAAVSALFSRLPSGAMIVLVCTLFFLLSMVFGTSRGLLIRRWRRTRLNRTVDRQHLLRAAFELTERQAADAAGARGTVALQDLLGKRSWSLKRLTRAIRRASRSGLLESDGSRLQLTPAGAQEAARLTRQHRLWELFLITYAEVAPSRVDREADAIEHVLEVELVSELEALLDQQDAGVPASPHSLVEHTPATAGPDSTH